MHLSILQLFVAAAVALRTHALRGLSWKPKMIGRSLKASPQGQTHARRSNVDGVSNSGTRFGQTPATAMAPIVICGPSGVGKGTLLARLFHTCGDCSGFAVSHTTRACRPGETEGVDYYFTTRESMLAGIERGEFLEHVEVHGNKYGTSYAAVDAVVSAGKVCFLDLDCQGVREIMERPRPGFAPHFVFIRPPSVEALQRRLEERNTESASQIAGRVSTARGELLWAAGEAGDFGRFDGVVENADLDEATRTLFALVAQWHPHLAPRLKLQFPPKAKADELNTSVPTVEAIQAVS